MDRRPRPMRCFPSCLVLRASAIIPRRSRRRGTSSFATPRPELLRHSMEWRLTFHYRVVIREGVKSLNAETAVAALDVDVAERPKGHPAAGIEAVQDAVLQAIDGQLFLKGPKDLWIDRFKLEAHLIAGAAAAIDMIAPLPLEPIGEQPPLLRQRMLGAGGHLRERQPLISPTYEVAGARDAHCRLVGAALDRLCFEDLEQLRMQRTTVNLKRQLGNFGANG